MVRYASRVIAEHDANGDGRLDKTEQSSMRGQPERADLNRDGQITVDEFARYVAQYGSGRRIRLSARREPAGQGGPRDAQPGGEVLPNPADQAALARRRELKYFAPLPSGTPPWFVERDADGDAQLTLAEFSPKLRTAEIAEFNRYDVNQDGLVTAAELSRTPASPEAKAPAAGRP